MLVVNEKKKIGLELSDEWVELGRALLKVFLNYFIAGKNYIVLNALMIPR